MIDLNRLVMKGSMELNMTIKSGDVIHVPFARNAYILGSVNKPGNVPVKDNITATQAVAMAGGQNIQLASNNVTIVRLDDKGAATTLQLNLGAVTTGKEPDIVLKENDIVFVQESGVRRFFYDFKNLFPGSVSAGASMAAF
jgi:protein involved in polysaccharide export with SLBB domain